MLATGIANFHRPSLQQEQWVARRRQAVEEVGPVVGQHPEEEGVGSGGAGFAEIRHGREDAKKFLRRAGRKSQDI